MYLLINERQWTSLHFLLSNKGTYFINAEVIMCEETEICMILFAVAWREAISTCQFIRIISPEIFRDIN